MGTNKTKNYLIQDAFKALDMIEDEAVLNIEEIAPIRKVLSENKESTETEIFESNNMEDVDAEIEKLNKHLHQLKEKYDINQKDLTEDELKQLKESGIIEKQDTETSSIITEEQKIDIADKTQVEKGLEDITKEKEIDDVEMVVDVDAETVDELQDNYIGKLILQCPVCRTLIYKAEEDIIYSEDDKEIVNVEDACPHCKSEEGFTIVGMVAPIESAEDAESGEHDKDDEKSEKEDEEHTDDKKDSEKSNESEEDEEDEDASEDTPENESLSHQSLHIELDELNETLFDKLATKYLNSIYENVNNFTTDSSEVDEEDNKIILEGTINFNSGKKTKTKFVFEATSLTKRGRVRFVGMNEALSSSKKTFTLIGRIIEKTLLSESLTYNYTVKTNEELKRVYGRVTETLDLSQYNKQ